LVKRKTDISYYFEKSYGKTQRAFTKAKFELSATIYGYKNIVTARNENMLFAESNRNGHITATNYMNN
jgi:hypothetical protein